MDDKLRRSRKQEKSGAERYGGVVNSGSGNGDLHKNDVRTGTESIEFKTTTLGAYRLRIADLETAWRNALMDGRRVVFGIQYERANLVGAPKRWVTIPEDDYLEMRDRHCGEGCTGYDCDFCAARYGSAA